MATVILRAPLRDLADGHSTLEVDGTTVGEVVRGVERDHPRIAGWILDETGSVRRHVNVFLNGEKVREDAAVAPGDRIHVLPSITGGCDGCESC